MEKKLLYLTTFLLVFCSVSFAQPTLTATGIEPVIGDSYFYTATNYFTPGSAGASQTWNFSTITTTGTAMPNFVNVSSTPSGSSFPGTNVALHFTGSSYYTYLKTSATAYQNYGNIGASTVLRAYSDPEDYLHFPFTYNDTYTDPWSVTFDTGGVTLHRIGTTTVTADGYGTLITPAGTFMNVTRIHMLEIYRDTLAGTSYSINYSNDIYLWYVDGTHDALAECFTFTSGLSGVSQNGFYLGMPATGVNDISTKLSTFDLFPNPASDKLTVDFTLTANKNVEIRLYNEVGQKMEINQTKSAIQGLNSMQLDVTALPEGIYFAQILLEGNVAATKRFVVSK